MKNKLVVVTDLGMFKAYRMEKDALSSSPRLELLEDFETVVESRISDQVTDQAGQFHKGSGSPVLSGEHSNGERHNIRLEQERRVIKQLAEKLAAFLRRDDVEGCYFAANSEINRRILDQLHPEMRSKIQKNVASDLTKIDKSNLLKHF